MKFISILKVKFSTIFMKLVQSICLYDTISDLQYGFSGLKKYVAMASLRKKACYSLEATLLIQFLLT